MPLKDKILSIRISEKLLEEYKQFCDENSINFSKRIRKFMEKDVENWKLLKAQKNKPGI